MNSSSNIKRVVCALSGGVDSCVAAILLKQKGYNVQGVFMRNWDISDETGHCTIEDDRRDAEYVCRKLGIPFLDVSFVKEYWNNVFSNMLLEYKRGFTPNPDILCNQMIKFNAFLKFVFGKLKADAVATGHYARVKFSDKNGIHLYKGVDRDKDQTFFLSQVSPESLRKVIFPLGDLKKADVKKIAEEWGFHKIARKKESTGICFIGRRNFQDFINNYVEPKRGYFIDITNGKVVGEHTGVHCWTVGQRCMLSGKPTAYYVAEKIAESGEILVAPGRNHPALFHQYVITSAPHWISDSVRHELQDKPLICDFRFQHREPLMKCVLFVNENGHLEIFLKKPLKALTPGQFAVFYKNEECLGSAKILSRGASLYRLFNQYPEIADVIKFPDFYNKNKMHNFMS